MTIECGEDSWGVGERERRLVGMRLSSLRGPEGAFGLEVPRLRPVLLARLRAGLGLLGAPESEKEERRRSAAAWMPLRLLLSLVGVLMLGRRTEEALVLELGARERAEDCGSWWLDLMRWSSSELRVWESRALAALGPSSRALFQEQE